MFDINKARDYRENYFLKNMDDMTCEQLHEAQGQMLANEIELLNFIIKAVGGISFRLRSVPLTCDTDVTLKESVRLLESTIRVLQSTAERYYNNNL